MKKILTLVAAPMVSTVLLAAPADAARVVATSQDAITIKHTKFEKSRASAMASKHCAKSGKIGVLVTREVVFLAYMSTYLCE